MHCGIMASLLRTPERAPYHGILPCRPLLSESGRASAAAACEVVTGQAGNDKASMLFAEKSLRVVESKMVPGRYAREGPLPCYKLTPHTVACLDYQRCGSNGLEVLNPQSGYQLSGMRTATTSPRAQTSPLAARVADIVTLRPLSSFTEARTSRGTPIGVGRR